MSDTFNTEVIFREDLAHQGHAQAAETAAEFARENGVIDYRLKSVKTEDAHIEGKPIPGALKVTHTWEVTER